MRKDLTKFYSPSPNHMGSLDLNLEEIAAAIELIRDNAPIEDTRLDAHLKRGTRIQARWIKANYDQILGVKTADLENALVLLRERFEAIIRATRPKIKETVLSARWTLDSPSDSISDEFHADSHFAFCALTGVPIEFYEGFARGRIRRLHIGNIIPEGSIIGKSSFGEILEFDQNSAHRRGIKGAKLSEPALRISLKATFSE